MQITSGNSLKLAIQTTMIKKSEEIAKNQVLSVINGTEQNLKQGKIQNETANYTGKGQNLNIKI